MARRTVSTPAPVPKSISHEQGISLLHRQIEKANELLARPPVTEESYRAWNHTTRDFLVKTFGSDSPNVNGVMDIGEFGSFPMNAGEAYWARWRANNLTKRVSMIESLIELLETEIQLEGANMRAPQGAAPAAQHGEDIFIVHGQNEGVLQETARFVERLGLNAIVLKEQPNHGNTIIEKFLEHSKKIGFAIVLLTGDDRGGPVSAPFEEKRKRARQNVILELGFFLGSLGRRRVCALYEDGVEIPSDYQGVIFVKLDAHGAWRFAVAKEIKAAGIPVDLNNAV